MTQLSEKEMQLASLISETCSTPAELTAKLKNLFAGALEKMLEAELDEHLGYEKNSSLGINSGNSRNGYVFFASTFCRKLQVKNAECCTMHFP